MSVSRMDKVNQQIKREIGSILLTELNDPRFQFVTITAVEVSKDLRSARVFFSVLDNAGDIGDIQKTLNRARGTIRRHVGDRIKMRNTPELNFYYDKSIVDGFKIEETLKDINDES